jgi:oligopeptidase A
VTTLRKWVLFFAKPGTNRLIGWRVMAFANQPNPLLDLPFRIPFDRIQADHVEPAAEELLKEARQKQAALAAPLDEPTFERVLAGLDTMTERLDRSMSVVHHLENVATNAAMRAAFNAVVPKLSAFHTGIPLDAGLWRNLKAYAATPEAAELTGTRRRFLRKEMESFRRLGADLAPADKARLEAIDVELTEITTRYAQNVLDATNAFEMVLTSQEELAGLPESAVAAARESARRKGLEGWRFTLQEPDRRAISTYLDNPAIRRQMYEAFTSRATSGAHDNRAHVARILQLRREKAALLGFANFADLVLDDRMAHTGEHALAFLDDLHQRTEARFREETAELAAFRRESEGPDAPPLAAWDIAYYAEKERKARFDFDEESLKPYFPLDKVVAGLYSLVKRLYGIDVEEETGVPVWDPAVRYFNIRDTNGQLLGGFYADWFPRENKRGGAWMDSLVTGGPGRSGWRPHLGLICGNLTPPIAGQPALLTHREVQTIFHEFGHLLHHLLSRVELRCQAGTNVAWDFVELPSQIMENWCWEREALDLFARHHETGAPIPDELFARLTRARTFRSATEQMRQLGLGTIDLAMHVRYDPARDGDVVEYTRRLLEEYSPTALPECHAMVAGFTHLFADPVGYGAGYYSYKWAEVLDADAFTRFKRDGIFSRAVGDAFRECILSKGDSADPAELYRQFMGRDPDPGALLERLGLR